MADTNTNNPQSPGSDPITFVTPDEAVQILRSLRERIPVPDASRISHARPGTLLGVDPHFINASVNAIDAVDAVQSAVGLTGEEARQQVEATARWTAFTDELRTMLAAAVGADRVRRQSLGLVSLQTYSICKQLSRDRSRAPQVTGHLQEMKKLNRLGRVRSSRGSGQPADPTPTSHPPVNTMS